MSDERELIAQRVKGLREAADHTPEQVAERSGIDSELYAAYESGTLDIPVGFLKTLADIYKVDLKALLTGGDAHARQFHVTRRGRGPVIERRSMYHYEALGANFAGKRQEPFIVTVEPGLREVSLNSHTGQEFNYVLSGVLEFTIGGNVLRLESGDSIYFDASVPHGMRALDGQPSKFLAIIGN